MRITLRYFVKFSCYLLCCCFIFFILIGILFRFVSRSRSPHIARSYRSTGRSLSPRDHSSDERECKTRGKIRSPKDSSPHDEKEYKSARRSHSSTDMSPHYENYKSSRSPTLRENSPHAGKHSRSPGRSISPKKESPFTKDCKAKQREVSPDGDYRSNKISLSSQEIPGQDDRRGMSSQKISSPRKLSSDYERGHRSKQRSISPGKNGGSPFRGRNMSSSKMKARSLSPSRSLSHRYLPSFAHYAL